jgi:hypothetical protein
MDSCRPHYAATWPPLLHAAALWLNASDFHIDNGPETPSNRFHLLFGTSFVFVFLQRCFFINLSRNKLIVVGFH